MRTSPLPLATVLAAICLSATPAGAQAIPVGAPEHRFVPPPGAKVIYRCDFDEGKTDGWSGRLTSENALPGSKGAMSAGPDVGGVAKDLKVPLTEETVLSFYVHTPDCPTLVIQASNQTGGYGCRSHCFLYSNVHFGKWTQVYWPLTGALVENNNNRKWPAAGDVLANLAITKQAAARKDVGEQAAPTILVDEIVVFSLDGPGKVVQARAELKQLAADLPALAGGIPALAQAVAGWQQRAADLEAQATELAKRKDLPYAQGKALYEQAHDLVRLAARAAEYYPAAEKAFGPAPDLGIGTEHTMVHISDLHWAYPFRGEMTGTRQLFAARHQFESFQAVVMPFTKDLKGVNVAFSDLKQEGGSGVIPAANCTWRVQPYVQLRPTYHYPGYDWLAPKPDPLLPGEPFDLPATRYTPLWITVYTPPDIPPGDYRGTMTVKSANGKPAALAIDLRVWDYNIPLTGVFRGQTNFDLGNVARFYKKPMTPEWRREWYDFILKYRFSPTAQYKTGLAPSVEDFEFCKQRGCNLWLFGNGSFRGGIREADINRELELARQAGVLDATLAYIADEPGEKRFKEVTTLANQVHAKFLGLKVMIGGSRPRKELVGYVDVWDPIMNFGGLYGFDPEEIRHAQTRGEQVMWYTAASPWHPYPNVQMGDPMYAARIIFWLTWKYRITGFEYYYWNLWADNMKTEPRWPQSPWNTHSFQSKFNPYNGDGMLCYPGPGGRPAASVRLENIRDGIQDWETFHVLETALELLKTRLADGSLKGDAKLACGEDELITAAGLARRADQAVAIDPGFCDNPIKWQLNPQGLLRRRNEAGLLVEAIQQAVGKEELARFREKKIADRKALEARRLEANRQLAIKELAEPPKPDSAPAPAKETDKPRE